MRLLSRRIQSKRPRQQEAGVAETERCAQQRVDSFSALGGERLERLPRIAGER